jgi:hypothetical protein
MVAVTGQRAERKRIDTWTGSHMHVSIQRNRIRRQEKSISVTAAVDVVAADPLPASAVPVTLSGASSTASSTSFLTQCEQTANPISSICLKYATPM